MKTIGNCLMGCLGITVLALVAFVGLALLASRLPVDDSQSSGQTDQTIKAESGTIFTLHSAKKDPKGKDSYMEIFVADRKPSASDLRDFAADRRKVMRGRNQFYYAVVFDNAENVTFPTNPFTAFYGMDEVQKHIIGYYETTNFNEYSKLTIGGWSSKAQTLDIK